jgi:hypothetical protein
MRREPSYDHAPRRRRHVREAQFDTELGQSTTNRRERSASISGENDTCCPPRPGGLVTDNRIISHKTNPKERGVIGISAAAPASRNTALASAPGRPRSAFRKDARSACHRRSADARPCRESRPAGSAGHLFWLCGFDFVLALGLNRWRGLTQFIQHLLIRHRQRRFENGNLENWF